MKVLLDTSFLMNCIKFKIDFFKQLSDYKFLLIPSVVDELNEISSGRGADAKNAKAALALTEHTDVLPEPEETAGDADASLLALSKEGYIIGTQDTELKRKVKITGGKVAYIRQRKIIVVE